MGDVVVEASVLAIETSRGTATPAAIPATNRTPATAISALPTGPMPADGPPPARLFNYNRLFSDGLELASYLTD